ncbi:MAG: glycosyltransferase family 2 protein, partial [Candidatus Bathyarchaeia archaeon]
NDPVVAGVGGPGLTPENDSIMQIASGNVLSSFMVGGLANRCKNIRTRECDDIHSCNFIARKSILDEVGGWNEKYWPGEDTLICLAIRKAGKKLVEASDVVIFHHRRPLFREHLKQVSRFGLHRGFFAKRFKGNSIRLTYFMPSLLLLFLFAGILAGLINPFFMNILLVATAVYLITCLVTTLMEVKELRLVPLVWLGIIATHFVYGAFFLAGLIKRDLAR